MDDITFELITNTDFTEYSERTFAAEIDGFYFVVENYRTEVSLRLRMGFSEASEQAKTELFERLVTTLAIPKEDIFFSDYSIDIRILLRMDWLEKVKRAVEILVIWAKDNQLKSACFLCGIDDPSVTLREIEHRNMYVCDTCENTLRQDIVDKENAKELIEIGQEKREDVRFGILSCFGLKLILSVIWIPIATLMLKTALSSSHFIDVAIVAALVSIVSTFLMIKLYKKVTGSISVKGFIGVSIVYLILSYVDILLSLPAAFHDSPGTVGLELTSGPLGWFHVMDLYLNQVSPTNVGLMMVIPFVGVVFHILVYLLFNGFSIARNWIDKNTDF